MMSINEIQQFSTPATTTIEEDAACLLGQHSEDGEESQQDNHMDSLDLTEVFDTAVSPTPSSDESGGCHRPGDSTSSSSYGGSSSFDMALHQDSRELLKRKMNKKVEEEKATKRLPKPSAYAVDQRISSDYLVDNCDNDDDDDDLHNDSRKLIQLKIKQRRATWSNCNDTTQDCSDDDDDDDDDSDDDLSLSALHNDSFRLLKNIVSRAANNGSSGGGIFHRCMSDSDLTAGLHNDSLNMLLGKKATTTECGDSRATMEAFIDQLDDNHGNSDAGNHASNNGSSSSILNAMHSRDSLRELAGVHHAPRRKSALGD